MATTLYNLPIAVDCGVSSIGVVAPYQQTLTLYATGGPVAVSVSALTMSNSDFALVSPPALPFNVTTTQALTIKFTPSVLGAESGTLTVTSNAGTGGSLVIPLVGIGGHTYTQHTLPPILNQPCGQINCYLFLDSSFSALTMPSMVKFLDIGAIVEKVDSEAGTTDIENIDITLAEDYTTYAEGFFYKLIVENPTLNVDFMFTIINGSNEEFLYRGTVYRLGNETPEYYLDSISSPGTVVRGMKFQLVSSLASMQSCTIGDLCALVLAHPQYLTSRVDFVPYPFVTLKTVFASMMELAFAGAYDESLIVDNGDFELGTTDGSFPGTTPIIAWINGLIMYSWFVSEGNLSPYTSWNQAYTYYDDFSDPWEVLKQICAEFGVVPKYSYGNSSGYIDSTPSNNNHRITFNTRGKSGTAITAVGNVISSSITAQTSRNVQRLYISQPFDNNDTASWYWDGVEYTSRAPDSWRQFDKTIQFDFLSKAYISQVTQAIYLPDGSGNAWPADTLYYWDYVAGAQASDSNFSYALLKYYFNRYTGRMEYTRTYGSLQANNLSSNSQKWMQNLNTTTITDGITSRNFYATEIHKDILKNQATVVWVEE